MALRDVWGLDLKTFLVFSSDEWGQRLKHFLALPDMKRLYIRKRSPRAHLKSTGRSRTLRDGMGRACRWASRRFWRKASEPFLVLPGLWRGRYARYGSRILIGVKRSFRRSCGSFQLAYAWKTCWSVLEGTTLARWQWWGKGRSLSSPKPNTGIISKGNWAAVFFQRFDYILKYPNIFTESLSGINTTLLLQTCAYPNTLRTW